MTSAVPRASHGSEFDSFLFTALGEDRNGLPLSVVSLLARMNLDPWQEAGTLATLPAEAAARRLTVSLDSLTDPIMRQSISETKVLRLLALLPRRAPPTAPAPLGGAQTDAVRRPGTRLRIIIFITSAIVLVGAQIFVAHRNGPSHTGVVPGPAVPAVRPPPPTAPAH
jgi:hypothetical protein